MNFKKYIEELKRRNVIKSAVAYTIVAWLILQIADTVLPTINAPDYLMKFILFILIIGFPINLIFAWIYDITPEGIQKTKDLDQESFKPKLKSEKLNKVIIGCLVIVVILLFFKPNWNSSNVNKEALESAEKVDSILMKDASIAVIPFANESSDKQNLYFVNGMTEDVRNNLSKISNLIVRSKTSSEKYRVTGLTSKEIGEELSINYLLEGTVQKIGNQVKIHAQLISTTNDDHLWQETYVRDISDVKEIFKVQSAIAQSIAEALKVYITPKEKDQITSFPTSNFKAYDYFLQGREIITMAWGSKNVRLAKESIRLYEKAINLDENFSIAYTGIGQSYWLLASFDKALFRSENFKKAKQYLQEAIRLDPTNGWAYSEMAVVNGNWDWNEKETRKNLDLAIQLIPNEKHGYIDYIYHEFSLGNCEKLPFLIKKLEKIYPISSQPYHTYNLMLLQCQKKYAKIVSIVDERRLESNQKKLSNNQTRIAFNAYLHENIFDRANEIINYEKDSIKLLDSYLSLKGMLAAKRGDRKGALKYLSRMKEEAKGEYIQQISFAAVYALLEEKEKMYLHLEKGVRDHEPNIHGINFYSAFDSYKEEVRFQEIIRKMWIPYKGE